jgi:hypothetical protein
MGLLGHPERCDTQQRVQQRHSFGHYSIPIIAATIQSPCRSWLLDGLIQTERCIWQGGLML